MKHRWGPPHRPSRFKTERECQRCGLIKVSRHEGDDHWTEWYRPPSPDGEPGDRIESDHTPVCEAVTEEMAS